MFVHQETPCRDGQRIDPCDAAWARACGFRDAPRLALDSNQEMFGNTGGRAFLRDFGVLGGRLHNARTDTLPLVLHCPGERRFRAEFDRLRSEGWDAEFESCGDAAVGAK